jgi:redox-sensitive bicupin YhaK (pirin superfamily)
MAATDDLDDPVRQEVPLGTQWPTVDPFLFCAHHLDRYPAGDGSLAPAVPIEGREIGSDFAGKDGWNLYHGDRVPGFPHHPHRGFETVTYVREGYCDHSDSLGAAARFGEGDTQWVTAGHGIVHSEMFPLLSTDGPNTLHLFQIWLNLPAADKLAEPAFLMLWREDVPTVTIPDPDDAGRSTTVTVIAGAIGDAAAPAPPPHSWAARPEADVAIWHLRLDPGARWELPPAAGADTIRTLYVFEGSVLVEAHPLGTDTGAVVRCDRPVGLAAGAEGAEVLVLQGRPIGEPVARYGPFVMNTEDEIRQAFADYQRTGFGGWPWDEDAPDHGPEVRRFARHADGRDEQRPA